MANYVLLTRLVPSAVNEPAAFERLNHQVSERLKQDCPEVHWIANLLVLGPYDYLDIFEAPDNEVAAKVALIVRSYGHGTTEIWPAVAWERFREIALKIVA